MERNEGWLGPIWIAVLAMLGVTMGGAYVATRADRDDGQAASSARDGKEREAAPKHSSRAPEPMRFDRALALIADFVSPFPMFADDGGGRQILSPSYAADYCSGIPAECAPGAVEWKDSENLRHSGDVLLVQLVRRRVEEFAGPGSFNPPVTVEFVVATLPDWIDSSSHWSFDPGLSAIQAAASAAGYNLTSFHIPDWDPSSRDSVTATSSRDRLRHEAEPGAVLFRKWISREECKKRDVELTEEDQGCIQLLLVLLVGETATGGVHKEAMVSALDLIVHWQPQGPIRVLGPSYTGSSQSLRASIDDVVRRHALRAAPEACNVPVRIVAINASARRNQNILSISGVSEFHSMVNDDNAVLGAMGDYLGTINPEWQCGKGVALLREENTAWGSNVGQPPPAQPSQSAQPSRPALDCQQSCADIARATQDSFPCALTIPFPAHLSRLRSDVTRTTAAAKGSVPSADPRVELPLAEGRTPIDRLPSLSPGLTAASTETVVGQLLDIIRRSGVSAVGILVTDRRDHVFLSSEITRRAPHVMQFAYNGSLMYLRPEVSSYLRGTIVASTYPLYARTQMLTSMSAARSLRQFDNTGAQGAFNGLLALLGREELLLDYRSPSLPTREPRSEERSAPQGASLPVCGRWNCPPVWISVVGADSFLPIRSYGHDKGKATSTPPYVLPVPVTTPKALERVDYVSPTLGFGLLLIIVLIVPFWHVSSSLGRASALVSGTLGGDSGMRQSLCEKIEKRLRLLKQISHGGAMEEGRSFCERTHDRLRAWWGRHGHGARLEGGAGRGASSNDDTSRTERAGGDGRRGGVGLVGASTKEEASRIREYRTAFFACSAALLVCGVVWIGNILVNLYMDSSAWVETHATTMHWTMTGTATLALVSLAVFAFWSPGLSSSSASKRQRIVHLTVAMLAVGAYVALVYWYCSLPQNQSPFVRLQAISLPLSPVLVVAIAACALVLILLAPTSRREGGPARRSLGGYTYCRRVVVLAGLTAAAALGAFALEPRDAASALFLADRAVLLSSQVSPTTFVVLICAALYWTGLWYERRLDLQLLPDTYVGVSDFIMDRARSERADEAISSFTPQLGRWWWLSPTAIVGLLVVGAGYAYTVEGRSFNVVVLAGSTCVLAMMMHVLVDNTRFGLALLRTLSAIDRHRVAVQFTRLAATPISWRPTFHDVRLVDLEPLADQLARSEERLRAHVDGRLTPALTYVKALRKVIGDADSPNYSAAVGLSDWMLIKEASVALRAILRRTRWSAGFNETDWSKEQLEILSDLEFVVLFFDSLGLRDLVTRLLAGFSTVVGGLVLLMLAHLLYVFQGRAFWLALDWIAIAVTTGLAMVILVRLEKDTVLSELWGTAPGRFSLLGGVSFRLVIYVVLTIITMIAVFFPEVGGGILRWVRFADPMRTALP